MVDRVVSSQAVDISVDIPVDIPLVRFKRPILGVPGTERPLRAIPGVLLSHGAAHQHHPEPCRDTWFFSGRFGSAERGPLYGFNMLKELYLNADPQYEGSEIIRMFYAEIDHPAQGDARSRPARRRTVPAPVRADIDAMNDYHANLYPLFETRDHVEEHLGQPGHQPYLFGPKTTEVDIRLYDDCSLRRGILPDFRCNLRMVRLTIRTLIAGTGGCTKNGTDAGASQNTTFLIW
ncbi:hypothetical protein CNMCM8980_000453 [Aspergillus fumigatiaffinis]|uniref:Uncharacterized protein n=1 Tax=Aspergillus fumigatiaffinis TaxID=340414 RepID=A0A8H4GZ62_9EURO|nr:hypothetical protein CNMCM5878_000312 [Aspergillus fumigatiaffinis]KAF4223648.1 hypothetical protein CNMCM6457_000077 [Aspergillus fumigatiaffinis]KAF4231342.1 hypothetical protein CNMCM6805_000194 [Aspergillus fumigatiaffinis]KAF4242664.1 hypothetical protein CNMCM8980_000453 [Aspergillus fumigatiaffinis]